MSQDTSRSGQVIASYKKHKFAASALRRIHDLIHSFETGHSADLRLAAIGLLIILVLIAVSTYFLLSTNSVILP